ncbi:MAG: metallophosphoesterase family protein [Acidimicrobiales bacterium]
MTVTVLQLSDIHLAAAVGGPVSGYDPDRRLATVLDAWRARATTADLVVLTGDNTDDGSADGYRRLRSAVSSLGAPVLAVPGNHDDPSRVAAAFGPTHHAEVGSWRVVGVDSSRPAQVHGTVDVAATVARVDALDSRPTIVAIHHAPSPPSTHPWFQLDGGAHLLDELGRRPHVRAVISGHLHDAFELDGPGATALLGCPSTIMAVGHDGDRYQVGVDAATGGRILTLHDDGSWSSELLVA